MKTKTQLLHSIRSRLYLIDRYLDTEIETISKNLDFIDEGELKKLEKVLNDFQSAVVCYGDCDHMDKVNYGYYEDKDVLINQWNSIVYQLASMNKLD